MLLLLATLLGCPPAPTPTPVEDDLGRIEDRLDDVAKTVWPGVIQSNGVRHVRLVNGFFEGEPTAYWFAGFASRRPKDLFWFCREGDDACPFDANGSVDRDRTVGDPVFASIPGEFDYSPFWLTWVVRVPDDYQANDLKSVNGIEQAEQRGEVSVEPVIHDHGGEVGPAMTLMHCLMVLDGTELERNGDPSVQAPDKPSRVLPERPGWFQQYRVTFYDFTETEGVFPPASDSQSVPLMPFADIFVFFRDCANGAPARACQATSSELGAVSERGVEMDLTGDGDKADNNNIISGLPRFVSADPLNRLYSALWRVNRVLIPVENDTLVKLIDSTKDQNDTMARSTADIRELVDLGLVDEPEPLSEATMGNQIPGNEGVLFFNCPSQVPEE